MSNFEGKTAIVTGGAQGMGREYVRLLVAEGANVVLADVNSQLAQQTADELDCPSQLLVVETDVGSADSCDACVEAAVQRFGGVDFLINNVGLITAGRYRSLIEIDHETYLHIFNVMTHGMLWMTRAACRSMISRGGGAIVNVSSIGAYQAAGIYSVTKAAVNSLTINLAHELAEHNIRVNAVAPGTVQTEGVSAFMTPEQLSEWGRSRGRPTGRVAHPAEIARVGLFLLSDAASYVRAQIVAVDDGQHIRL